MVVAFTIPAIAPSLRISIYIYWALATGSLGHLNEEQIAVLYSFDAYILIGEQAGADFLPIA